MSKHDFKAMRRAMVESQLRTSDVDGRAVIDAMASVPREAFVPDERRALAYIDRPVPLGEGRAINPPLATGLLLNKADIAPSDSVLLVGAATGYAAAVLARLARSVTALEESEALCDHARGALSDEGNVTLVKGALAKGHKKNAPYSLIVIDGAVESVPDALVKQLAEDGRLVTGLDEEGVTRLAIGRRSAGAFGLSRFADCECVTLPGFAAEKGFSF